MNILDATRYTVALYVFVLPLFLLPFLVDVIKKKKRTVNISSAILGGLMSFGYGAILTIYLQQ